MTGRSVWSDPEVRSLAAEFVCVADEVWRLKRKEDAEGDFFRRFCDLGHYRGGEDGNDTRQGIYAVTPNGRLLGSLNSRDAGEVAAMMRAALAEWERSKGDEVLLSDPTLASVERLESRYPVDGFLLRSYTRDLPREDVPQQWRGVWNQDFVWFTQEEAIALANPGYSRAAILRRFARTSLLDSVRGQTDAFPASDVVESLLLMDLVSQEGSIKHLKVTGSFRLDTPGENPRGTDCKMLGFADYDSSIDRFVKFEAVALGKRWGGTQFNFRNDDPGPSPIGWAFVLAGDRPEDRIAPAHFWDAYGW